MDYHINILFYSIDFSENWSPLKIPEKSLQNYAFSFNSAKKLFGEILSINNSVNSDFRQ